MIKKSFKIEGMHCASCAMNIDGELEDMNGVKESNTSYSKMVTEVMYDEKLITDKKIIDSITNVGYTATTK